MTGRLTKARALFAVAAPAAMVQLLGPTIMRLSLALRRDDQCLHRWDLPMPPCWARAGTRRSQCETAERGPGPRHKRSGSLNHPNLDWPGAGVTWPGDPRTGAPLPTGSSGADMKPGPAHAAALSRHRTLRVSTRPVWSPVRAMSVPVFAEGCSRSVSDGLSSSTVERGANAD